MNKKKTIITVISIIAAAIIISAICIFSFGKNEKNTDSNQNITTGETNSQNDKSPDSNTEKKDNEPAISNDNEVTSEDITSLIDKFNNSEDDKEKEEARKKLEEIFENAQ